MERKKIVLISLGAIAVAGVVSAYPLYIRQSQSTEIAPPQTTLSSNFFLAERFWHGVRTQNSKTVPVRPEPRVKAALVPHHLLAGELISEVFARIAAQNVKKIILISPNHHEAGLANLQSNHDNWDTPVGKVTGENFLGSAKSNLVRPASPETITAEHGVAGLMPYLAYYLPEVRVFSIIIKHKTPDEELEALAQYLAPVLDEDIVLLATVDFSHYLPYEVAERRDEYTKRLLLDLEERPLYNLNNDYLDSPGTLATMFKVCKITGSQTLSLSGHSNSALILNNPFTPSTTSYFTGFCEER